jgi:hypothetical protein
MQSQNPKDPLPSPQRATNTLAGRACPEKAWSRGTEASLVRRQVDRILNHRISSIPQKAQNQERPLLIDWRDKEKTK